VIEDQVKPINHANYKWFCG